jgi:xylulokinase
MEAEETMYLGIDLGTSSVKAVLIDDAQTIVAEATSAPSKTVRLHPGWSEQNPEDWWSAVSGVIDGLAFSHGTALSATSGIGLSGQMYGATVLDAAERPIRRAILWNDTRAEAECRELERREPDYLALAGRRPTAGLTAPKLMWLRHNESENFARIRTVLLPKDYVRLRLGGERASDMADSSGTFWMNVAGRSWSDKLLEASYMDRRQMPRLYEGTEATCQLKPELVARWGMARAPVIAAGGGDNACGACGVGVISPGAGIISLGTGGVLFLATDKALASPSHAIETLCHSVPGVWHQMAVVLSATACVNWLASVLRQPAAELVNALGPAPRAATPLLFLPYLDGCWSPNDDPDVRGAFIGLTHGTDQASLVQSVLQGITFAILDSAEAFRETGAPIERLIGIGGGSKSPLWLSMIATCLDVEIDVPDDSAFGSAFGAARLGMIAATGADPATVLCSPTIAAVVAPARELSSSYRDSFERWRSLYAAVRNTTNQARPTLARLHHVAA